MLSVICVCACAPFFSPLPLISIFETRPGLISRSSIDSASDGQIGIKLEYTLALANSPCLTCEGPWKIYKNNCLCDVSDSRTSQYSLDAWFTQPLVVQ